MNDKEILLAADLLFNHRLNKSGLKDFPDILKPKTIIDAYKIQKELKILYLTLKDNDCNGKKIGCTNKIAQKQLGLFEPFYGNLFTKYTDFTGCKLNSKKFLKPFAEAEISLVIKDDININDAPFSLNDAEYLFSGLLTSIELVEFRFGDDITKIGINNLISTNGASEYWIRGVDIQALNSIDLNNHHIDLYSNGKLKESGNVNAVLGNPINSAIWLINKLSDQGEPMLKGQFVSTGTCTKALPILPNTQITADFGSIGKVEIYYN